MNFGKFNPLRYFLKKRESKMTPITSLEVIGEHRSKLVKDTPPEEWRRGICPECGDYLVSNLYYTGKGYILRWQCWSCDYSKVM